MAQRFYQPENVFTELCDALDEQDLTIKIFLQQKLSKSRPARLKLIVENADKKLITLRAQDEHGEPSIYTMSLEISKELKKKGIL